MKKYTPLFILAFALTFSSTNAQQNYHGYNNTMVPIDFDNNGIVDDVVGFNTDGNNQNLNLWQNNNIGFIENKLNINMPSDLSNTKLLNGKIVSGDFDNDGYLDDIAAIYEIGLNQTSITVWTNNSGKYTAKQWWYGADFDANQTKLTLVSGDFDNDGFVDDLAAFYDYTDETTKVFVWKSDSEKFAWPGTWWVGNDFNSSHIQGKMVVGDFDHDGFIDDIAALYDYVDNYCKIFVWSADSKKFNWPSTYFRQDNFFASNVKGNVIAGDFNKNGFVDNIAAFYMNNEFQSEVLVWERNKTGFSNPETWWYGNNEGFNTNNRLVAFDSDGNGTIDEFSGIEIKEEKANLSTWIAENNSFSLLATGWEGIALSSLDCEKNGGCLPNNLGENIQIYPNPAASVCSITIPGEESDLVEVNLFNQVGSLVYKTTSTCGSQVELNVDKLKTGNYIVQVIGQNVNYRQKLLVE